METGGEIIESSVKTKGDRTRYNVETKGNDTKNVSKAWRQRKKEKNFTISQVVRIHSPWIRHGMT